MASQRWKDREDFFRDLERLDEFSDDEPGQDNLQNMPAAIVKQPAATRDGPLPAAHTARPVLRPSTAIPDSVPSLKLPSSSTRSGPDRRPAELMRVQTDSGVPERIEKRKLKNTTKQTPDIIPEGQQLFPGLCFYFVPNRDTPYVRKLRVQFAIANGATWAKSWIASVTHIIVDPNLSFQQAVKALPSGVTPEGIPLVNDEWLTDCSLRQRVSEVTQRRFLVKGMASPFAIVEPSTTIPASRSSNGNTSSAALAKPATLFTKKANLPPPPQVYPSRVPETAEDIHRGDETSYDELDTLIAERREIDEDETAAMDLVRSTDPSFKFEGDYTTDFPHTSADKSKFQCMIKNESGGDANNPNAKTIRLLQKMAEIYDLNQSVDGFRARAFRMAATTLNKQDCLVFTKDQALALPGIGKSIAEKIEEIVHKGSLGRLNQAISDPSYQTLNLFLGIYHVGHPQAAAWVAAGYRTLQQLLESAELTSNQKTGIEHYDDFRQRIPRDEVRRHGLVVGEALKNIDPALEFVIGGSYRRGNKDSGDIDILITKEGGELGYLRTIIMETLIPHLKKTGFIVAELASGHRSDNEVTSKWMGASCLPDVKIWRRLDLLFVPWAEMGAALCYWTGNAYYNRSLRLLAGQKGMRLNQHGLFKNAMRGPGRVKITEGELVVSHSEKEIHAALGVTYRPPEHRNP
ncbi:uncharacterized protein HMPREF1541_00339 [Cyphellophora europaea CBS 101466]|uniref:DNA polymerase n=1 Tax=Cyphellophora europaea (strain CBS 101466) TaxID=1220924 RepID=W2SC18_CYPE1|nr:uncharacterized protein HMPREF1541_00339 [Cyphellophora europaea CBS 101466]ETN46155.1 hypothetical protein HMPREF1541_00339 [Cyphellophora europaea CBS 101466]